MKCGTGKSHCCWFEGAECPYVKPVDKPPFKWACSLREEHGSWEAVYNDRRYKVFIAPHVNAINNLGLDCGDWPEKTAHRNCNECN